MSTYTLSPTRWRALAVPAAGLLPVGGKLSDIFGAEPGNSLNAAKEQSHISGFLDGGVTPQPAGTHQEDPR